MNQTPKDPTATERQRRHANAMREQGSKRLSGWLKKEQADKLAKLIETGYGHDKGSVIARAIDDAFAIAKRKQ